MTDDVTWPWKVKVMAPMRLGSRISKTDAICSNDRWLVCCEAVRSAILATAWLLVMSSFSRRLWFDFARLSVWPALPTMQSQCNRFRNRHSCHCRITAQGFRIDICWVDDGLAFAKNGSSLYRHGVLHLYRTPWYRPHSSD